jgi:hypothetical protein
MALNARPVVRTSLTSSRFARAKKHYCLQNYRSIEICLRVMGERRKKDPKKKKKKMHLFEE